MEDAPMLARLLWLALLSTLVLSSGSTAKAKAPDPTKPPGDAKELVAAIDRHIAHRWTETGTEPAPLADDS